MTTTTKRIETELWAVADLKPYDKNAKKHSKEQVRKLARTIKEHGWTQPIVIDGEHDRGVIVVGHGRRLAAIELGLEKVAVQVLYGYSPEEIDAIRLADNRVTSTDYDTQLLQEELARLSGEGVDLETFGFDAKELEFMTVDLGAFDEGVFAEDVTSAVEAQVEQNQAKIGETDAGAAPIGDAFGFKRVSVAQSRRIRQFMAHVEANTGLKGVDALLAHIDEAVS